MTTTSLKQNSKESHLRVIKYSENIVESVKKKIYINTLFPGFSFINEKGETIIPRKCILQ